jgi:hypothetical protein
VLVGFGAQLNFLELDPDLLLFRVGRTFALLIFVLAIVHDPTNRGLRGRRNFDQVKAGLGCSLQGGIQIHNTQLIAFIVNDANFTGPDSLVDIGCVLAYDAPPNDTVDILPE